MSFLHKFIQPFRFIARYRTRQALARVREWKLREAERDHQAALLKLFLTSLETIQEASAKESTQNSAALIEVAKSVAAQAQSFSEWMKCFQTSSAPTTSVVRDEDEYREEQMRNIQAGIPADIASLPEEFRLAWALRNDPNLLLES